MNYKNAELSIYEKGVLLVGVALTGLISGWLFYDSLVVGAAAGVIIFYSVRSPYIKNLTEKRQSVLLLQFRDLLYSVSTAVSAGRSLGQALEESVDFWQGTYDERDYIIIELKDMVRKMRESNMSDIDVLEDLAERSGLEDIRDLVMVCDTCKKAGGDFVRALNKSADMIGDKITLERELKTMMAQKKFEGRVVSAAPFVLIFAIKILSPSYLLPLTATGAGRITATAALAMIGAGGLLIERVNNIEI